MNITNKKAFFEYFIYDKYEAGISLYGTEVKSVRENRVDLSNSYVKFIGDELFLINATFSSQNSPPPPRSIKLLLHRREITQIASKIKAKKLTIVPLRMYNRGNLIKVEIALAKSKRSFEKKEAAKKKDLEREIEKELKEKLS